MTEQPLGLFDGPAPRIRAAPASAAFLDVTVQAIIDALVKDDDPFSLSDAVIIVNNQRAARGLVSVFADRLGGAALLPSIRPLLELDNDPRALGLDSVSFDLPTPIEPTLRRLELAALIRRRDKALGGAEDPARAIALADELCKILDSAATADVVHWDRLSGLVEQAELAKHWELSAQFLTIISQYWPRRLAMDGLVDPGDFVAQLLRAFTDHWTANPTSRPVVLMGSTGSIGATRALMRAVASLPRGVVVLPGLDNDLDEKSWDLVSDQHPQYALKQTLAALGVERDAIPLLSTETPSGKARRVLMREALAPAEQTADWLTRLAHAGGASFVQQGAEGLRLVEAATEEEEASAVALLLREAIENQCDAALVTPDVALARRVESKLARWGVQPSVSHGRPLRETEAGVLLSLLCELARDPSEPVALAAFLKHPRVTLATDRSALTGLEHTALRGARRYANFAELKALIVSKKDAPSEGEQARLERIRTIVTRTEEALAPLIAVMAREEATLADFADAITQAMEGSARTAWQGRDGEDTAALLREAIDHGAELQAMHPALAPRVLLRLMDGREVPPAAGGDPRVAIWGPLEARLQRRSLMILGGLNEGVWPAPPGQDPFLSRGMRDRLGLPSLDQRIGLAAHDFAQLANAPNVVLTRVLRRDGQPTLASRWLWRLQTLMLGAHQKLTRADDVLAWARALDHSDTPREPKVPKPKPPAGQRLKRLSVTQVETLIRDPYALYARRILGLEVLKPIGAPAGPAERGIAVHRAIERFEDGGDHALLSDLLDEELRRNGISPERRAAERARLQLSINALIEWFEERRARGATVYREAKGELPIDDAILSGIADRIEISANYAAILDFKTGAPPSLAQVQTGLSPQLPLEAAMLKRRAFPNVPKANVDELIYWQFGGRDPTPKALALEEGAHGAGEEALAALTALLRKYADPNQPFLSKPRVLKVRIYDDYDLLARRKEWADAEGDE